MTNPIWNLIECRLDNIDGMTIINPATGDLIARAKTYSVDEVSTFVDRVEIAGKDWAALTARVRAEHLRDWYEQIMAHRELLASICTSECDKPLAESLGEVAHAASFIEWFAEEAKRAYGETIPIFAAGKAVMTFKEPGGTCAATTPWNFPLAMITHKAGPALAAGCAIIVKPGGSTPPSALALEALAIQAGVPTALFRVVPSERPAEIGELFCSHPNIRKLSFTGSTAIGNGADAGVRLGPLIDANAIAKVSTLSDQACAEGAELVCGGTVHDAGALFFKPTVLTGVTQDMAIASTEIFGPIVPVIKFANEADAIRIANHTHFGLAVNFYARDARNPGSAAKDHAMASMNISNSNML